MGVEVEAGVFALVPAEGVSALERAVREVRTSAHAGPLGVLQFDPAQHAFAVVDRWGKSDDLPRWSGSLDQRSEYAALSKRVGEVVVYLALEDGAELLEYAHWKDGELVRFLSWGDGHWERVEGTPQAWEAQLFAPKRLEALLQNAEDDGLDADELRAAFAKGTLEQDASWPTPGYPDGICSVLWRALRAPSVGFRPWPRRNEAVAALENPSKP